MGGHKFRLQFEHASSPTESVAAAKKLVEQDKVFVLVLASGSTSAAAAADYVREVGVR
jgi:branched-chain amino acid transport system substrate-binding protein